MLERFVDGELTNEQASDPDRVYPSDQVEWRLALFTAFRRPIAEVLGYEEIDGMVARVSVTDDRGRPMMVRVIQHPEHPGRVWLAAVMHDPLGVEVREAGPRDGAAIRALELATPIEHGGVEIAYDRPDPFAQDRLRPLPVFRCVAEIDGHVIATHADALHVLHAAMGPTPVIYRQHSRVHPDHQGGGIMPAMNGFQVESLYRDGQWREVSMFMARGNAKVHRWFSDGASNRDEGAWSAPVVRYALDSAALGTDHVHLPIGVPSDVERVHELLCATHGASVLWPDPSPEWVADRLSRSSADYTWNDLVLGDSAMVGVWDAGWSIVRRGPSGLDQCRVATVLDWGFEPGHPDAFEEALRAACSRAVRAGIDQLLVFAGPPAPGHDILERLAIDADYYQFYAPDEPADSLDRGLYIDPLYF